MGLARLLTLTVCVVVVVDVAVAFYQTDEDHSFATNFLIKYGYLTDSNLETLPALRRDNVLRHAIEMFQEYYGLAVNGELSKDTLELMRKPRCGMRDIPNHGHRQLKWPRTNLTWNFYLADEVTLNTTKAAFDLWSRHSALTFERVKIQPDILLSWREHRHLNLRSEIHGEVCTSSFDGPNGVVAHAYPPNGLNNFVSEVHVDLSETWHISVDKNPPNTMYLLLTLVHEIGHSLGLPHSEHNNSVMFPFISNKQYPVVLGKEDILKIQNLYNGEVPRPPMPPQQPPRDESPPSQPDLCALSHVNAVLLMENRLFISYGRHIWSVDLNGESYRTPVSLSHYMLFLHENFTRISGAYQSPNGNVVLFVDNLVYVVTYPDFKAVEGWPKTLQQFGLPIGSRVNGAVNTHRGRSYVIYNGYSVGEIDECTMKFKKFTPVQTVFPGIPIGVTSVFRHMDGNLYFIIRRQYYKFNEFTKTVEQAGRFDLRILNIVCPDRIGLLQQLRDLLNRIARLNYASSSPEQLTSDNDDGDDDFGNAWTWNMTTVNTHDSK